MKTDAAIRRTRDARYSISASVADDPVKLVEYYMAMQKRFGVRLQPGPGDAWDGPTCDPAQETQDLPSPDRTREVN